MSVAETATSNMRQYMLLVFVVFLIATGLALAVLRRNSNKGPQLIPSPAGDWLSWTRTSLPFRAQDVMRRWALECGELFQIRIGWYNWVVVNSPQAMKEIFDKQVSPHAIYAIALLISWISLRRHPQKGLHRSGTISSLEG